MAIKINGQDLLKRYINGQEIVRVYKNGGQIRPETIPPVYHDYLCFTAQQNNSTIALNRIGTPMIPSIEISYDGSSWYNYIIPDIPDGQGGIITLSNVGDKVYMRGKSETPNRYFSVTDHYRFSMTGLIGASGDMNYIQCKNSTKNLSGRTACYYGIFSGCTSLTSLPTLTATSLGGYCYSYMFSGCTRIKLSATQTSEYQTAYRIPSEGTGTVGYASLSGMFNNTGGTFTGTPSINTTYYTSNQVI